MQTRQRPRTLEPLDPQPLNPKPQTVTKQTRGIAEGAIYAYTTHKGLPVARLFPMFLSKTDGRQRATTLSVTPDGCPECCYLLFVCFDLVALRRRLGQAWNTTDRGL